MRSPRSHARGQTDHADREEYALLEYLLLHRNKVHTRDELYQWGVGGSDFLGDSNLIDVYIRYLRGKIDERLRRETDYDRYAASVTLSEIETVPEVAIARRICDSARRCAGCDQQRLSFGAFKQFSTTKHARASYATMNEIVSAAQPVNPSPAGVVLDESFLQIFNSNNLAALAGPDDLHSGRHRRRLPRSPAHQISDR